MTFIKELSQLIAAGAVICIVFTLQAQGKGLEASGLAFLLYIVAWIKRDSL